MLGYINIYKYYVLLLYLFCLLSEVKSLSHVQLFAKPWTVVHQSPLSLEFSKKEYLSGLPFPSPGHLPDPGLKLGSPALQKEALRSEPPGKHQS